MAGFTFQGRYHQTAAKAWQAALAHYEGMCASKAQALRRVVRGHPEIHKAYLLEINASRTSWVPGLVASLGEQPGPRMMGSGFGAA